MTGDKGVYPYLSPEAPREKISYSYSTYRGMAFINDWKNCRAGFIGNKSFASYEVKDIFSHEDTSATGAILDEWISGLLDGRPIDFNRVDLLLKRFEVTKRIYVRYDDQFRALDKPEYSINILYLKFALVLSLCYQLTKKLQYLNTLLKTNDILCSLQGKFSQAEKAMMGYLLSKEIVFIETLIGTKEVAHV